MRQLLQSRITKKHRRIFSFILAGLLGIISTLSPAWSQISKHERSHASDLSSFMPLQLAQQGQKYYNAGQFEEAVKLWQQASQAYEQAGDQEGMVKSLINQSQALQDLGLYSKACKSLLHAFSINNPDCSQAQLEKLLETSQQDNSLSQTQAIGLRSLGDVLRRQGLLPQSKKFLLKSLSVAKNTPEESTTLLSLGNTERALGNQIRNRWDYEKVNEMIDTQSLLTALEPLQQALNYYKQVAATASAAPMTKIQAQINHFSLLWEIRQWWSEQTSRRIASWSRLSESKLVQQAENFLSQLESELGEDAQTLSNQITSSIAKLPPSRAAIYARINFAQTLLKQGSKRVATPSSIAKILTTAVQHAQTLPDKRAEAYALGYLGKLYYEQGQLNEATKLTQQALMLTQELSINGDAREIAYLWQAQLGRLLRAQGDIPGAIASYSTAFNTLASLRIDLNANDKDVQFDFRQEVKPVYLELADLLLQSKLSEDELSSLVVLNPSTSQQTKAKTPKNRLELARRVLESLQLAELDNFFQDPCSEATDVELQIDALDSQAAVIYPIIFPNRLEILLSLPGKGLREASIPITEKEVNETLDRLYDTLYNESVDNSAINIFRTIPLDPEEVNQNIQKLVPIFAQVYDWLIRPIEQELDSNKIKTLVFVLNDRLQRVPIAALYNGQQYLIEKYGVALVPSLQLLSPKQVPRGQIKVMAAGVSQQIEIGGEIFPALNEVSAELNQIKATFPNSQTLLNEKFTATALLREIEQFTFPVVHLATHGLFSSNPENTFLVTGDRNTISINQLSNLLSAGDAEAPELLVLSACETATGDERAVLGLAGVAVRSGARSTLATLWAVGDASTAQLMGQFYQKLKTGGKKLDALRSAQLSLIESLKSAPPLGYKKQPPHPYYWASYVLVGNWQ